MADSFLITVAVAALLGFLSGLGVGGGSLLLRHWLLVGFGLLFAVGHIYVTTINAKGEARTK